MNNDMNPYDLAWKGITIQDKRKLLDHILKEHNRLIEEGKAKDAQLGLASACVDIIATAKAALKESKGELDRVKDEAWRMLLDEAVKLAIEAVDLAERDGAILSPVEFEVAGAAILATANDDAAKIDRAIDLFRQGTDQTDHTPDLAAELRIYGQIIKALAAKGDVMKLEDALNGLERSLFQARFNAQMKGGPKLEPKDLTRIRRSMAVGNKFLAIYYAKEAGSENQELKARNI